VQESRYEPFGPLLVGELSAACVAMGKPQDGLDAIAAFEAGLIEKDSWCMPELLRRKAEVLLALGRHEESEAVLRDSIQQALGQGALAWATRSGQTLAGVLEALGRDASSDTSLAGIRARTDLMPSV